MSTGVRPLTNSNLQKALVGLENGRSVAAESGEGLMATNSSRRLGAKMSAAAPVRRARPSEKLIARKIRTNDGAGQGVRHALGAGVSGPYKNSHDGIFQG